MQYSQKLDEIEARFDELTRQMADPQVIGDPESYRKTAKSHRELTEVVTKYREWKQRQAHLEEARHMLQETDPDLRQMAVTV